VYMFSCSTWSSTLHIYLRPSPPVLCTSSRIQHGQTQAHRFMRASPPVHQS
jgi:hypothetical protein